MVSLNDTLKVYSECHSDPDVMNRLTTELYTVNNKLFNAQKQLLAIKNQIFTAEKQKRTLEHILYSNSNEQ